MRLRTSTDRTKDRRVDDPPDASDRSTTREARSMHVWTDESYVPIERQFLYSPIGIPSYVAS